LTAKSSITLDHCTAPRRSPSDQTLSRPNSSHNRHPSQHSLMSGVDTPRGLRAPLRKHPPTAAEHVPPGRQKSRRWHARPSSSITSMERCHRSICVVFNSPRLRNRRCTTRSRPTRVSQPHNNRHAPCHLASYFPLQEHAAIFSPKGFLVYKVGPHTPLRRPRHAENNNKKWRLY
jgi:hypothetical protein